MACLSVISKNLKNEEAIARDWAASDIKKHTQVELFDFDLNVSLVFLNLW